MLRPLTRQQLIEKIQRRLYNWEDRLFEWRHGLELGVNVVHSDLITEHQAVLAHATAYQAVWCQNLRVLFREATKTGIALRHFVDIGSGKGKACFYAARRLPVEHIIGVEFSRPLIEVANNNLHRFNDKRITFHCADATTFALPDGNTLVFMFNPFDVLIFTRFIENHLDHFKRHQSLIAYANDNHHAVLPRYGFETLFRSQSWKMSLHRIS